MQVQRSLLHAQHHALGKRLLIFHQRTFAPELHVRACFFQRFARNLLEALQRIGGNAMHLIRKSGGRHLRRLAHLVAFAGNNFFRRFVNLRGAVLHIRAGNDPAPKLASLKLPRPGRVARWTTAPPSSPSSPASCCAPSSDTTPKPSATLRKSRAASRCCAVESLLRSWSPFPGLTSRF